ncbi:MAG: 2OG-Fe(II) oxygenase [Hyphomicrobiaceae bacterium]
MSYDSTAVATHLVRSFHQANGDTKPYPHWFLTDCLPSGMTEEIAALPFPAPALGGISGKRELHNATRKYFDHENQESYPAVSAFSKAFQSSAVTDCIQEKFGTDLSGTYLRIEYAQDTNGFWLEPHTDLGVKVFTMLIYLSPDPSHKDLGTDIYDAEKRYVGRSPFKPNSAMVFIPSTNTYHGFEPRPIEGIRKSIIINYVTNDWRAREQLAFPEAPIAAGPPDPDVS